MLNKNEQCQLNIQTKMCCEFAWCGSSFSFYLSSIEQRSKKTRPLTVEFCGLLTAFPKSLFNGNDERARMNVIKFTEKPLRSLAAERWDVFVVVDCQWYWNEVDTTQDTNDVEEHSDSTIKNKSDNGTKIQKKRSGGGGGNDDDVKHQ